LLNVLGMLDRPTTGTYRLAGIDVAALAERDRTAVRGGRIGFVFQDFRLLAHRTALENVMLAQLYTGTPRAKRRAAAAATLAEVGLDDRRHALPTTLSGGQRQRVAIARALVNSPSLLLCDEPTGSLDTRTSQHLLDLFDALHRAGLTIVVITHAQDVAARADRLASIVDGNLTEATLAGSGRRP
jgi:putative ABC transport system ATP-binding protein